MDPLPLLTDKYHIAVNIQMSGETEGCTPIAIGAIFSDKRGVERDSFEIHCYMPGHTYIDPACMEEYWSQHRERLAEFVYDGPMTHDHRQAHSVRKFYEWRVKCEAVAAADENSLVELITDNGVFHMGIINQVTALYLADILPMPYTATKPQKRYPHINTRSLQEGVLCTMSGESDAAKALPRNKRIQAYYALSPCPVPHDGHPCNNARNMTHDYLNVMRVRLVHRRPVRLADVQPPITDRR